MCCDFGALDDASLHKRERERVGQRERGENRERENVLVFVYEKE
jgi:hypothetical protein